MNVEPTAVVPRPKSAPVVGDRILVVDDDKSMADLMESALRKRGFDAISFTDPIEALAAVDGGEFAAVLTDLQLGELDGLEVCQRVLDKHPDLPVIVITAYGSMEAAVGALRVGAYDFVTKPVEMEALGYVVERAVKYSHLQREVKMLRGASTLDSRRMSGMIGDSPAMREVSNLVTRVAASDASVLITGESGTGKELVARALHDSSGRSGRFVPVNCAAMPEQLLESELFGHVRGAFTDAKTAKHGLFVEAQGGTVFLDEIGELPIGMQPKLLRALQERRVRPIGSTSEVPFEARLVTATNRDLETEVSEGRFREDLFYRINVVRVELPPLRARGNDVLLLAQHFLANAARRGDKTVQGLTPEAAKKIVSYTFPGNVRELENAMERAVALARYDQIAVEDLPEKIREHKSTNLVLATDDPSALLTMEEIEQRYMRRVLELTSGNKTQAAKILGFDRRTLYRKIDRYGIEA